MRMAAKMRAKMIKTQNKAAFFCSNSSTSVSNRGCFGLLDELDAFVTNLAVTAFKSTTESEGLKRIKASTKVRLRKEGHFSSRNEILLFNIIL